MKTSYRIAEQKDYKVCHKLLRESVLPDCPLHWPTVVAERDGKILGFLSTQTNQGFIEAGPLVVSDEISVKAFIALRLAEAYENILKLSGIHTYYFGIEKEREEWIEVIKKMGFEKYKEYDGIIWFRRRL